MTIAERIKKLELEIKDLRSRLDLKPAQHTKSEEYRQAIFEIARSGDARRLNSYIQRRGTKSIR